MTNNEPRPHPSEVRSRPVLVIADEGTQTRYYIGEADGDVALSLDEPGTVGNGVTAHALMGEAIALELALGLLNALRDKPGDPWAAVGPHPLNPIAEQLEAYRDDRRAERDRQARAAQRARLVPIADRARRAYRFRLHTEDNPRPWEELTEDVRDAWLDAVEAVQAADRDEGA